MTRVGAADISPGAVASSVLQVSYTSSDTTVAKIVNNKIHAVGNGQAIISAFQPGNPKYNPSPVVKRKLIVYQFTSTRIEAEKFNGQSGIQTETCSEGGQDVAFIDSGDYTFYNNINLSGASRIDLRVAGNANVGSTAGTIEIRTGSQNGVLLGSIAVPGTGGWQVWTTISCQLKGAQGTQKLYLVYKNNCAFNVNWLEVISDTPTGQKDIEKGKTFGFKLFPNPTDKNCQIGFYNSGNELVKATLILTGISGGLILSDQYEVPPGNQLFGIETGSLKPGVYLAECVSNGYRETIKLVVR